MNNYFDDLLSNFCAQMGMEGVQFDENGQACFEFEDSGRLNLQKNDEKLIVSLGQPYDRFAQDMGRRALAQSHYDSPFKYLVRSGLTRGDDLILSVTLDHNQADVSVLEDVIDELGERFRRLQANK